MEDELTLVLVIFLCLMLRLTISTILCGLGCSEQSRDR